ncbi:MAG TPA: porin family protein [Flavisolibacter sp.]|nr:porin family protein [Flavisolibacter sp.]
MRKTSCFILLWLGGIAANAQTNASNKTSSISFGIKGGINFADYFRYKFPSGTKPGMDWSVSFHSGITLNAPLKKKLSLQTEVLYTGAGSKSIFDSVSPGPIRYEQRFHYLSLPLLLQRTDTHFLIETGPVPAYLVKAKQIGPGGAQTDNKNSFHKFDLSWAVGIGYVYKNSLGFGIRYTYGLTSVLPKKNSLGFPINSRLQNSVVQIGVSFHSKK